MHFGETVDKMNYVSDLSLECQRISDITKDATSIMIFKHDDLKSQISTKAKLKLVQRQMNQLHLKEILKMNASDRTTNRNKAIFDNNKFKFKNSNHKMDEYAFSLEEDENAQVTISAEVEEQINNSIENNEEEEITFNNEEEEITFTGQTEFNDEDNDTNDEEDENQSSSTPSLFNPSSSSPFIPPLSTLAEEPTEANENEGNERQTSISNDPSSNNNRQTRGQFGTAITFINSVLARNTASIFTTRNTNNTNDTASDSSETETNRTPKHSNPTISLNP